MKKLSDIPQSPDYWKNILKMKCLLLGLRYFLRTNKLATQLCVTQIGRKNLVTYFLNKKHQKTPKIFKNIVTKNTYIG